MELSDDELFLLLDRLYTRYGYDLRGYAPKSLKRRILRFAALKNIKNIEELGLKLTHDPFLIDEFTRQITVNVTEMFRDHDFYLALWEKVIPRLATYPIIRVWIAGCSTGEEAYSVALLLSESGLLGKSIIYATDINRASLEHAKEGVYNKEDFIGFSRKFGDVIGRDPFAGMYRLEGGKIIIPDHLKKQIVFAPHNLATDQSFNEFHLIVCRNVLIYFNNDLKKKALQVFFDSLVNLGFFAMGLKESIQWFVSDGAYRQVSPRHRIWQKTGLA